MIFTYGLVVVVRIILLLVNDAFCWAVSDLGLLVHDRLGLTVHSLDLRPLHVARL